MPEIKSNCGVLIVPAQRITSFLTSIFPTEPFLYITLTPSTLSFLKSTYSVLNKKNQKYISIYMNKIEELKYELLFSIKTFKYNDYFLV